MARRKNGHLVRVAPAPIAAASTSTSTSAGQLQLELGSTSTRATFLAVDVEGDEQTVAAAMQFAAAVIGGRHG